MARCFGGETALLVATGSDSFLFWPITSLCFGEPTSRGESVGSCMTPVGESTGDAPLDLETSGAVGSSTVDPIPVGESTAVACLGALVRAGLGEGYQ